MTRFAEVGPWAKDKLESLSRYLDFYTKVLKNQRWKTIYLDAYAGGGRAILRADSRETSLVPDLFSQDQQTDSEARELIDGSPRVALAIANPFDRYVLIEPDPKRAGELEELKREFDETHRVEILRSTASEGIEWLVSQSISRGTHRGVAFLDPFGTDLNWRSIQQLAQTGLFEVVINFALSMAIQRMLPNSGEVPQAWINSLDNYFGGRAWFEAVYQARSKGLFVSDGFEKRADYSDRLLELYRSQLRSSFGYVSKPRLIRNTRGAPLYYLLWAGPHAKGLQGADYILAMGERLKDKR